MIKFYVVAGVCALSEAEKHFDSEICKILIKDGGADPSCLDRVQLPSRTGLRSPRHSPPPTETIPTSPRIQARKLKIRQRSDPSSPCSMNSNRLRTPDGLLPDYLAPDSMSLRKARSFDSASTISQTDSIPEVEETEEDDEECEEDMTIDRTRLSPYILPRQRRSSLSLPDLRIMPRFLISTPPHASPRNSPRNSPRSSPRVSPRSSFEEAFPRVNSPRCERSHTIDEGPPLPQLSEEDEDAAALSPTNAISVRRGSKSLPDLRECRGLLLKLHLQACNEEEDKRPGLSCSEKRKSFRKRSTKNAVLEISNVSNMTISNLPSSASRNSTGGEQQVTLEASSLHNYNINTQSSSSPKPISNSQVDDYPASLSIDNGISSTTRRKFFSMRKT